MCLHKFLRQYGRCCVAQMDPPRHPAANSSSSSSSYYTKIMIVGVCSRNGKSFPPGSGSNRSTMDLSVCHVMVAGLGGRSVYELLECFGECRSIMGTSSRNISWMRCLGVTSIFRWWLMNCVCFEFMSHVCPGFESTVITKILSIILRSILKVLYHFFPP